MAARGTALSKLCFELATRRELSTRELSTTAAAATAAAAAAAAAASLAMGNSMPSMNRIAPPSTARSSSFLPSVFTSRGQARGFRIRDLFNKELAAERKAALRADLAVGHFDDLKGAKTASKPFAARAVPERAALLLPSLDLDVVASSTSSSSSNATTTLGEVLSRALDEAEEGEGSSSSSSSGGGLQRTTVIRGPPPPLLLLLGSRASAERALDSWAAAWARVAAESSSSSSSPSLPIVDLTLFDRVSPILLALPGGKGALLRGAAEGARRRGAAAAAAHFGSGDGCKRIREALGATNALAGYCCVLDCERERRKGGGGGGSSHLSAARVRWIGAGEAEPAEEEGLREVLRSLRG